MKEVYTIPKLFQSKSKTIAIQLETNKYPIKMIQ